MSISWCGVVVVKIQTRQKINWSYLITWSLETKSHFFHLSVVYQSDQWDFGSKLKYVFPLSFAFTALPVCTLQNCFLWHYLQHFSCGDQSSAQRLCGEMHWIPDSHKKYFISPMFCSIFTKVFLTCFKVATELSFGVNSLDSHVVFFSTLISHNLVLNSK